MRYELRDVVLISASQFWGQALLRIATVALLTFALSLPFQASAFVTSSDVCLNRAEVEARNAKVPLAVLSAIATLESGRRVGGELRPWPWTVHAEGKGHWFDTKSEAVSYVTTLVKSGVRNIDVGCFQLNLRWHGRNFESVGEMFDPAENARYAASFLRGLYGEYGAWEEAAVAYHSRTPRYAQVYRNRLAPLLASFRGSPGDDFDPAASSGTTGRRTQSRPPFRPGGAQALASLVPLSDGPAAVPLFGVRE
ncbi:transglycosylase SLT domain-containing protein [Tropicimonas marinistellae]|uniref:transglycosylase SLT domain-containing protein n=1 Tax=Tropicimonas marinistellae TaxID=1739787 RepID=UPI00098F1EB0|nr:transglycosylase SLT domain-containing protein [Tropicimonas marinistellae]